MLALLLILAACTRSGVVTTSPTGDPESTGTTRLPTTTMGPTTPTSGADELMQWVLSLETLPGITGYGDFSNVDPVDVNLFLVAELIVQCANDRDVPIEMGADGTTYKSVKPETQSREAQEIVARCRNGLNVPYATDGPYGGYTLEQAQRVYDHHLWVRDCLAEAGFTQAEPPSFNIWLEDQSWNPFGADTEPDIHAGDVPVLTRQCPPFPGGRGDG